MAASTPGLALERRSYYSRNSRSSPAAAAPSSLINSIFMSTVNTAARTLVSMASSSKADQAEKWRPADHLRFMFMLTTWMLLWVLRVLMDYFPGLSPAGTLYQQLPVRPLGIFPPPLLTASPSSAPSNNSDCTSALALVSSSSAALTASNYNSLDMILFGGSSEDQDHIDPSVNALGRALSHVLALLNEIPANSRKYQFAMTMADRIMDENASNGHAELLHINRTALSSAFAHTSTLLCRSLHRTQSDIINHQDSNGTWPIRIVRSLPMGNYIASYVKGVSAIIRFVQGNVINGGTGMQQLLLDASGGRRGGSSSSSSSQAGMIGQLEDERELAAEKLAQELLWITIKMRDYGAVNEALEQWSFSSSLASASLTASPRVQGFILKIFATLFTELTQDVKLDEAVLGKVKFGLLVLWLPLCCHAGNGLSYPTLTGLEKADVERAMDRVISSLPPADQEVILTNWFLDFTVSASDWPNLQASYDRWCHCTRKHLV